MSLTLPSPQTLPKCPALNWYVSQQEHDHFTSRPIFQAGRNVLTPAGLGAGKGREIGTARKKQHMARSRSLVELFIGWPKAETTFNFLFSTLLWGPGNAGSAVTLISNKCVCLIQVGKGKPPQSPTVTHRTNGAGPIEFLQAALEWQPPLPDLPNTGIWFWPRELQVRILTSSRIQGSGDRENIVNGAETAG